MSQSRDARKETIDAAGAIKLLSDLGIRKVLSRKGKTVSAVHLGKDRPGREELRRLLVGPGGNLRAPTLRVGRTLIVGFDEDAYREALGG